MNRCRNCNAVVNTKWSKCLVCESPLSLNYTHVPPISRAEITSMELTELAKRDLIIQVYSELLDKQIFFAGNEEMSKKLTDKGLITYLPQELKHLIKIKASQDQINKIHMIKEVFPGSKIPKQ